MLESKLLAFKIIGDVNNLNINGFNDKGLSVLDIKNIQIALKIFNSNESMTTEDPKILEGLKIVYHKLHSKKILKVNRTFFESLLTFFGVYKSNKSIFTETKNAFSSAINQVKESPKLSPEEKELHDKFDKLIEKFNSEEEFLSGKVDPENKDLHLSQIRSTLKALRTTVASRSTVLLLNNGKGYSQNSGTNFMMQTTGLRIHPEKQAIDGILKSAPEMLMNAYEEAFRTNTLPDFFAKAFDINDGCLEARMGTLMNYQQAALQPPDDPNENLDALLTIDPNQSTSENLRKILGKFLEDTVRSILKENYTEEQNLILQGDEEFQKQHSTPSNFEKYLLSKGYLDQITSDGTIRDNLNRISAEFVEYGLLEPD